MISLMLLITVMMMCLLVSLSFSVKYGIVAFVLSCKILCIWINLRHLSVNC